MTENNADDRSLEALLEYLKQSRGFDFTGYKRASLKRRIRKQMQSCNIENFSDYLDYLEVHPEEYLPLFNTILINVTAFFRDKKAWNYLERQTIPHILREKSENSPIRIWSAGCASGEEAYTLAMILAKTLGVEKFRDLVKIYATDIDEEALTEARHATYSIKDVQPIPEEMREEPSQ
ncbi:MAG: CheR family methyltransferase [Prochloraceae cyanobacterium]|nr:CheR family methyltransferase [Prochloraceae cyanobacterium]